MSSEVVTPLASATHLVPVTDGSDPTDPTDVAELLDELQALAWGPSTGSSRSHGVIVASLAYGHLRTTATGVVAAANAAAVRLLSHEGADDLVGRDVLDLVAPHHRRLLADALQGRDRSVHRLPSVTLRSREGEHVEMDAALGAMPDGGARLLFARAAWDDAHEGWDPRAARLYRHLPVVGYTCRVDDRWSCEAITPWVTDLLGFTAERWRAEPRLWLGQVHPEDRERLLEQRVRALEDARRLAIDYRIRDADGAVRWLHDTAWFELQDGVPVRAHGMLTDVTSRHRSRAVLEQLCESERQEAHELREQLRSRTTLLEILVHDARTPLVAAREWLDVALGDSSDVDLDVQRDMLACARDDLDRLGGLLRDVHERQRLLSCATVATTRRVQMRQVVHRVLDLLDPRDHEVTVEGDATVRIDAFLVERLLANLVDNAFRHSPAGTTVNVRLRPADEAGQVWLAVEDEGDGVPEIDLVHVFQPLFRRGGDGTGMGLAIVHDLAEALGGRAWVANRAGGGASFQVVLPDGQDQVT